MSWLMTAWVWLSKGWHSVLAIIPASALWKLFELYRNRIRVRVRKLGLPIADTTCRGITFEAENISSTTTSFEPIIQMTGYAEKKKHVYQFRFQEGADRQLLPHVSKSFVVWHSNPENRVMLFLWWMTFELKLSRGRTVRIRVKNADGFQQLGFFRFHWKRLMYLWLGKL